MTYRVLIADDESLARERMRELVAEVADFSVAAECATGEAAVKAVASHEPDVLLLDVQMPGFDGFDVAEAIADTCDADHEPLIVFVTAHDRYALRAFEAAALDYLLKPVGRERFALTMRRVRRMLENRRDARGPSPADGRAAITGLLVDTQPQRGYAERFAVRRGREVTFVAAADVDWLDAAGNYVRLHSQGKSYMLRALIGAFVQRLDPRHFLRIHRSAIVRLDRIVRVQGADHGEFVVTMADGARLSASRTYSPALRQILGAATHPCI